MRSKESYTLSRTLCTFSSVKCLSTVPHNGKDNRPGQAQREVPFWFLSKHRVTHAFSEIRKTKTLLCRIFPDSPWALFLFTCVFLKGAVSRNNQKRREEMQVAGTQFILLAAWIWYPVSHRAFLTQPLPPTYTRPIAIPILRKRNRFQWPFAPVPIRDLALLGITY